MAMFNLPKLEEERLQEWEERGILAKILQREGKKGRFVFFEGPPTANGKPGFHHMLTRAFKDVVLRFRTMQGYAIDRKAGWDTHGLPVELEVEKQLGFTKKQDIEQYGIAAFNAKCRESVWKYLDLWEKSTRRIGFWIDLRNPYVTYRNDYVESLWWIIKEISSRGLLYQGYRVTPHCPRCVTSLSSHELAQGYKDVEDPSVYVRFALKDEKKRGILVWTTTPWTLPANVALAVGADILYAIVKVGEEELILAKERLEVLDAEYSLLGEVKGSELVGSAYAPLYATLPASDKDADRAYKVYAADFVSTADGTGIVHIAPAYGEDDARLGQSAGLPTLHTVAATGEVIVDVPGKGKFFKKADADIEADLAERGILYRKSMYLHSYPFCWRCGTPILYFAKSSWYIRMSGLRDRLLAMNARVNWVPDHIRDGRFGEWLREVKDWAFSRERYWGTPLPIWKCGTCEKTHAVGSLAELDERAKPRNTYFLQRHGGAENNAADIVSCYPEKAEWHLTEKGRAQIKVAAEHLKAKKIDMIFASDLLRTTETAKMIAEATGAPLHFDPRLRELNVGDCNGKEIGTYHALFTSKLERFSIPAPHGESLSDARKRMVEFVKELESKYSGKNIVIVGHGDPLWLLESGFAGLSDEQTLTAPYPTVGETREMKVNNVPHDENGRVDVHRPFIDEVALLCDCGGEMRRVPDVVDVWFDSGAMPYAQWHYPFQDKERIDGGRNYPADFICEAIDQTRGWFYTLLAVATLLDMPEPPYKNVICMGHMLDAKGQKMSKSKGNTVDPFAMIDKYGADAMRFYIYTVNQPGDVKRFDEKALDEVVKKTFLILMNVVSFYEMFADQGTGAKGSVHVLDRWILSELADLLDGVTADMERYDVVEAGRRISAFIDALSTWYVRRSRDRFKSEDAGERAAAVATLGAVLRAVSLVMAPFTPFISETVYRRVGGLAESVHLEDWPTAAHLDVAHDLELRRLMSDVRQACSLGLEQRKVTAIPVRQALASATVSSPVEFADWMKDVVADELNVHEIKWEATPVMTVALDTKITPELEREGAARDFVRQINEQRKQIGLTPKDSIKITYAGDEFWDMTIKEFGASIAADTLAVEIIAGAVPEGAISFASKGHDLAFSVVRV